MRKQPKCLLLFLALLLSGSVWAKEGTTPRSVAQLQPVQNADDANKTPDTIPNIYRFPPQTEGGLDILTGLSVPDVLSEVQHHWSIAFTDNSFHHRYLPFYFIITRYIPRALTIKKIIFPFHSFL